MKKLKLVPCFAVILLASTFSQGADKVPSAEQRNEMAKVHDLMAACLRSTKPIEECHKEMKKSCEEQMERGEGCMMMEHGMGKKSSGAKKYHKLDEKESEK
jgi:hypothetical protein